MRHTTRSHNLGFTSKQNSSCSSYGSMVDSACLELEKDPEFGFRFESFKLKHCGALILICVSQINGNPIKTF